MGFDVTGFKQSLRAAVGAALPSLCEHTLDQMQRGVAAGWHFFYTQPLWALENAPAPHLNELGKRYLVRILWQQLQIEPGDFYFTQLDPFVQQFDADQDLRKGYRNLFYLGELDLTTFGESGNALDQVVNDTANRLLHEANRHVRYELLYNRLNAYRDAIMSHGSLTPAPTLWHHEAEVPVRDETLPLADDSRYWHAVYKPQSQIVADVIANRHVQTKPDTILELMGQLVPDFPYATQLSNASRLVFVQQGEGPLAWALIIEKVDKGKEYHFPPKLVLLPRELKKKFQYQHCCFVHHEMTGSIWNPLWPREVEIQILFNMSRLRRLIDFYAPLVDQAMRAEAGSN